jgi:hypothetical protein
MTQMKESGLRKCVACGYDLFGLGDEPRCPECGLLNIPEGFRREVWELVDSGRWFFSGFFTPFRKRPPGWWWALDREDDLRKSIRTAIRSAAIASLGVVLAVLAADGTRVEVANTWYYTRSNDNQELSRLTLEYGLGCVLHRTKSEITSTQLAPRKGAPPRFAVTAQTRWGWPEVESVVRAGLVAVWAVLTWLLPASVGLWTQIRKGLPDFARAPRTIFCASMYESHRLVYLAVAIALASAVDALMRVNFLPMLPSAAARATPVLIPALTALGSAALLMVFATVGWVGPLRSDFTRQLVRSRLHATRVVIMYVLVFPLALAWSVGMLYVFAER